MISGKHVNLESVAKNVFEDLKNCLLEFSDQKDPKFLELCKDIILVTMSAQEVEFLVSILPDNDEIIKLLLKKIKALNLPKNEEFVRILILLEKNFALNLCIVSDLTEHLKEVKVSLEFCKNNIKDTRPDSITQSFLLYEWLRLADTELDLIELWNVGPVKNIVFLTEYLEKRSLYARTYVDWSWIYRESLFGSKIESTALLGMAIKAKTLQECFFVGKKSKFLPEVTKIIVYKLSRKFRIFKKDSKFLKSLLGVLRSAGYFIKYEKMILDFPRLDAPEVSWEDLSDWKYVNKFSKSVISDLDIDFFKRLCNYDKIDPIIKSIALNKLYTIINCMTYDDIRGTCGFCELLNDPEKKQVFLTRLFEVADEQRAFFWSFYYSDTDDKRAMICVSLADWIMSEFRDLESFEKDYMISFSDIFESGIEKYISSLRSLYAQVILIIPEFFKLKNRGAK
ncbi:MAG: hypothetical protein PHO23_02725 [Candidatus Pacebacteria bacterium]|nr:hypothetical protein [Candidatus Paceibacterota bacterium]